MQPRGAGTYIRSRCLLVLDSLVVDWTKRCIRRTMYRRSEDGLWRVVLLVEFSEPIVSLTTDKWPEEVHNKAMKGYANVLSVVATVFSRITLTESRVLQRSRRLLFCSSLRASCQLARAAGDTATLQRPVAVEFSSRSCPEVPEVFQMQGLITYTDDEILGLYHGCEAA